MRKWLLVPVVLLLAVGSIYWFIPSQLTVVQITPVHCPASAAFRSLSNQDAWRNWWPSKDTASHAFQYGGSRFQITKTLINTFDVQLQHAGLTLNSTMNLLPLPADSVAIKWTCTIPSGLNPFTRIQRYQQAIKVKNIMAAVSNAFRAFAEKKENLYGIAIRETSIKDTLLIAYKIKWPVYPNTTAIYTLVQSLKKYISDQQATQTGYPMVNITPLDNSAYQLMVAIPINKRLPDKGPFFQRHMVPGKFLFTTIQGGPGTIQHTFKQLQLYVEDFRRTAMAIPFQLLVTDRMGDPDTSKWITHIYVPVF
jgi:hypothetical protein